MLKTATAALALALLAAAPAYAKGHHHEGRHHEYSPLQIVQRHMNFVAKGDIEAILRDFADDGVTLTAGKQTSGKANLRKLVGGVVGPGKPVIHPLKIWSDGNVGFVAWEIGGGTPNSVRGTDSFLVRHGKIEVQAVWVGGNQPKLD